jgi:4-hydroxy-4-methyl-2-oxoglutarate aldolase
MSTIVPLDTLAELATMSSPSVANGIERFKVRPNDTGYMDGTIICRFPQLGPVVGYAVTARIRAAGQADELPRTTDLWRQALEIPEPRIVVIEDLDERPGVGSFWGEVNANVFRALGCRGVITNGGVRDLAEMEALGFHTFSSVLSVSHAYVRVVEVGIPVRVGGLTIHPGDLLHGDCHGVVLVPTEIAARIPDAVRAVEAEERRFIDFLQSPTFTAEKLIERASQAKH